MPWNWFLVECDSRWVPLWFFLCCAATNLLCWLYKICWPCSQETLGSYISTNTRDYFQRLFHCGVIWSCLADSSTRGCPPFRGHTANRPAHIVFQLTLILCALIIFLIISYSSGFQRKFHCLTERCFLLTSSANVLPGGFSLPHTHSSHTAHTVISIPWKEDPTNPGFLSLFFYSYSLMR